MLQMIAKTRMDLTENAKY